MTEMEYSAPTVEEINEQMCIYSQKAEEVLSDRKKAEALLVKIKKWLSKHRYSKVFGATVKNISDMVDLLTDYLQGRYTAIPTRALVALVAAVIYIVSPIDLIPDWIVGLGWIDDITVVSAILKFGLDGELRKYRNWENAIKKEHKISIVQEYLRSILSSISDTEVLAALFLADGCQIELLIANKGETDRPLPVRIVLADVPIKTASIGETIYLFNTAMKRMSIEWSDVGSIDFMFERDFDRFDELFVIIGG